jgi:hypothetical protein
MMQLMRVLVSNAENNLYLHLFNAIYHYFCFDSCLGGESIRQQGKTLKFAAGHPIFDLSEGEITSIKYHYLVPKDIVGRSISKGFWTDNPMIKPAGFTLKVPRRTDPGFKVSSPVTGSEFYEHLKIARRAFDDPNHQVSLRFLMQVIAYYLSLFINCCSSLRTLRLRMHAVLHHFTQRRRHLSICTILAVARRLQRY